MFKGITKSVIAIVAIVILGACTPSKQYAGSSTEGAFFSVPNGWTKVSMTQLSKEEGKSSDQNDLDRLAMVSYQVGFSKNKKITPKDIFMLEPTDHPVLYARFRDLFPEERNSISLNTLRDIILPITQYVDGSKTNDSNFQLLDDQEITEKGGKGVNLLFSFDYNGVNETVNQTALYSNDQNKIYLLIIRCSSVCYNKNINDIDEIVKSFTVRGAR
jgi:hypothetical protein